MTDRTSEELLPAAVIRDLAEAKNLAIVIDLDGTLLPLSATPPTEVDPSGRFLLADLDRLPGVTVVVVSGRTRSSLAALLPSENVWLVAEHGAWRRGKSGTFVTALEGSPGGLRKCADGLEQIAQRYRGAWVEPKSWAVCFHYRLVPAELHAALLAELDTAVLGCLVSAPEYERLNGSATVEVRHRGAHKGTAIDWVLEELGGAARLLVIGDDVTDEDAFRAAGPDDVTVRVGRGEATSARYTLANPEAVRELLRALIEERTSSTEHSASLPPAIAESEEPGPRLVVVSNRLPPPSVQVENRRQNVGGLVSALGPALEERGGGFWLGWSGRAKKGLASDASSLTVDVGQRRAAMDLAASTVEKYYDGFCNRTLWPLLHGFLSKVRYDDDEWRAYVTANRAFAEATLRIAPRDATVWVHDYHLMLVARELRARGHTGRIGFFLHVPLPSVEFIETLPWSQELLGAMMDYDLVGFHTDRYVSNYVAAQATLAGAEGMMDRVRRDERTSRVGAFPIGIAPEGFLPNGEDTTDDEITNLIRGLADRRLILGVDRLDYSKGIPERLRAFQRFLETFPEWRRKVSFVQVSVPSREGLPDYAEQRALIEGLVGHVNGAFGDADWVPVRYLYRSYAQPQLARLYRAASVGLVTPLRDGMNLVAKEYVASQCASTPGVLLLSRFAGAAEQLTEAVLTNPFHACGVARDLDLCLRMPLDERRRRHERLLDVVLHGTAQRWASSFLEALESTSSESGEACATDAASTNDAAA